WSIRCYLYVEPKPISRIRLQILQLTLYKHEEIIGTVRSANKERLVIHCQIGRQFLALEQYLLLSIQVWSRICKSGFPALPSVLEIEFKDTRFITLVWTCLRDVSCKTNNQRECYEERAETTWSHNSPPCIISQNLFYDG